VVQRPETAPGAHAPLVAVFDLDGTITRRDALLPYVWGFLVRYRPWRLPWLLAVLPECVAFIAGRADHGTLKSALIRATLGGAQRARLEAWTARFVGQLLKHGVFSDALRRVAQHRADGDYLVLLSASPELFVPQVGEALGFAQVLCTGLTWNADTLLGYLSTPNRRGEEKVRCLEGLRGAHPGQVFAAYGNAACDVPHLRMVERPLLVNGNPRARKLARRYGIPRATWR
jgi:phosphatidylglycerophosphatase C